MELPTLMGVGTTEMGTPGRCFWEGGGIWNSSRIGAYRFLTPYSFLRDMMSMAEKNCIEAKAYMDLSTEIVL